MRIPFCKMHGNGNDFMVVDNRQGTITLNAERVKRYANRHTGVGFDQLLMINSQRDDQFEWAIYNSDGGVAAQCGNGARCVAMYIWQHALSTARTVTLTNHAGAIVAKRHATKPSWVSVSIPAPIFIAAKIPVLLTPTQGITYHLLAGEDEIEIEASILSVGNPHAIIITPSLNDGEVQRVGRQLQHSTFFPQGINVSYVQVAADNALDIMTYERGAGMTACCGSAACAAVVACTMQKRVSTGQTIKVSASGGILYVDWLQLNHNQLLLCGAVETIYYGELVI